MFKKQKIYIMAAVAFWGAAIYAVGWGLISWFTNTPSTYQVFSITVNRWVDVILFPIYLNMILSVYLWLFPVLEKLGEDLDNFITGLIAGLAAGFGAGFAAGLIVGFGASFVVGLGVSLAVCFAVSFVAGLIYLTKRAVALHKKFLKK